MRKSGGGQGREFPCTYAVHNDRRGFACSRYQEDAHLVTSINVPPQELRHSWQRYFGINWDPGHIGDTLAGQMLFAGIYDGYA